MAGGGGQEGEENTFGFVPAGEGVAEMGKARWGGKLLDRQKLALEPPVPCP